LAHAVTLWALPALRCRLCGKPPRRSAAESRPAPPTALLAPPSLTGLWLCGEALLQSTCCHTLHCCTTYTHLCTPTAPLLHTDKCSDLLSLPLLPRLPNNPHACSQYSPAGNYVDQYATNVQPLKDVASPPPAPPPSPPAAGGSGTASDPIRVPADLPWTSGVLSFENAVQSILGMDCYDENNGGLWDGDLGLLFSWTAPASGEVQLSTCGSTEWDTTVAVLTGTAAGGGGQPQAPTCVTGGDDGCPEGPGPSLMTFNAVAVTTYWCALVLCCSLLC